MKKLFTFLFAISFVATSFGQTIFQSNLSSWATGNPTDWMGSATSIAASNVVEVPTGANYGTSMAALINTSTSHKRFTTQNVAVTAGGTYEIKFWVSGGGGQIRTNFYNVTGSTYGSYNSYVTVTPVQTMVSQIVTLPNPCDSAQFILSLKSTDAIGILVDSVAISVSAPPVATPYTINQIQFTTTPPYDSPHNAELVETSGVVTGVQYNGYYLQDGNGPWNGIFVLDYNNVPTRGDVVSITGTVSEYFNLTEISGIIVYNAVAGGALPTPTSISTLAANDEQYEGVLVKVTNATCTSDTTASTPNKEWTINDGTGALIADDKMFAYGPTLSTVYDVTGVIDFSFSAFKILPRDINDILLSTGIDENENENVIVYPNPTTNVLNFELDVNNTTVQIFDITGKVLKSITATSKQFSISLSNFSNGIYFYSVADFQGKIISTNRFVVAK